MNVQMDELSGGLLRQSLEANGMKVTDAGPDFLKELKAIGAKMQSEWLSSVGSEGQAIVDAYNKM